MEKLTKEDWVEIYYAMETKLLRIKAGDYFSCFSSRQEQEDWENHLREIIDKIGPDGENMYEEV